MRDYRSQKTEVRRQKAEDRGQKMMGIVRTKQILFFLLFLSSVFCLLSSVFCSPAFTQGSSFSEANSKYAAQDFQAAASAYEEIVRSAPPTAAMYYNLGNAQLRSGLKGKALVSYERARGLSPRDEDVLWNIRVLKSVLSDRLDTQADNLFIFWIRKITDFTTADELSAVLALGLVLWMAVALLNWRVPFLKPWMRVLQFLVFLLLLMTALLLGSKGWEVKDPSVVVLDKEVYARYGPSNKETKAFLLHEGAEAKMTDQTSDWVYVFLPNKNSGWIPKSSCEVI